jgi:hypothetical protein
VIAGTFDTDAVRTTLTGFVSAASAEEMYVDGGPGEAVLGSAWSQVAESAMEDRHGATSPTWTLVIDGVLDAPTISIEGRQHDGELNVLSVLWRGTAQP